MHISVAQQFGHFWLIGQTVVRPISSFAVVQRVPTLDKGCCTTAGNKQKVHTTKGCELLVSWKDGIANWVPVKDLKLSNPVEAAECTASEGIAKHPCFNWWALCVLKKRDWIIAKVKSRCWKHTHKHGVELPHSVAEALKINENTGTAFWRDAV